MIKKIFLIATVLIFFSIYLQGVYAETSSSEIESRRKIIEKLKEKRQKIKEEAQAKQQQLKQSIQVLREGKKDATNSAQKRGRLAKINKGTISAINSSSLTVSKDNVNYTVNILSDTKFRRHFWGKSSLSEFSVGNIVNVWGKWTDDIKTAIDVKMIRNLSIMKRHGTFFGEVKSKGTDSFVIKSVKRGDQTVVFSSTTKFIDRKGNAISFNDIKVSDRVRIKGLWDKSLSKITDVSVIKDFSIPTKVITPTITPTSTQQISVTP